MKKRSLTGIDVVEFLKRLFETGTDRVVVRFEEDLHTQDDIYVGMVTSAEHYTYPLKFKRVNGIYPDLTWYVEPGAMRVCKVSTGLIRLKSEVIIHVC